MPNLLFIEGGTGLQDTFDKWFDSIDFRGEAPYVEYLGDNVFVEATPDQATALLGNYEQVKVQELQAIANVLPSLLVLRIIRNHIDDIEVGIGDTYSTILGPVGKRQLNNKNRLLPVGAAPKYF